MWSLYWDAHATDFGFKGLNNQELTTIHQTFFKQKHPHWVLFVHQSGPFQTLTSKATTPTTTAKTAMSPNNPRAICCLEHAHMHNAHQHKCHPSMEKWIGLNISSLSFAPKIILLVLPVLPSVQLAPPNCRICFPNITPLIFIHWRLLIPWTGMKRGAEHERETERKDRQKERA